MLMLCNETFLPFVKRTCNGMEIGLKMGVLSAAHTYHAMHSECPPPPPPIINAFNAVDNKMERTFCVSFGERCISIRERVVVHHIHHVLMTSWIEGASQQQTHRRTDRRHGCTREREKRNDRVRLTYTLACDQQTLNFVLVGGGGGGVRIIFIIVPHPMKHKLRPRIDDQKVRQTGRLTHIQSIRQADPNWYTIEQDVWNKGSIQQ